MGYRAPNIRLRRPGFFGWPYFIGSNIPFPFTDYVNGMDEEKLRQKLGLSRISWRDTSARLEQLREQIEGPRAS